MNLLPEGFTESITGIIPFHTKATGPEALQVMPDSITNSRDNLFNSEELFSDPFQMYGWMNNNYFGNDSSISLAQLFLIHDLCYTPIQVKLRAQYGASLEVYRKNSSGGLDKIDDHPFIRLMNDPNDTMHDQDYFESWTCHQNLFGKFWNLLIRENSLDDLANPSGRVIGIMPIRPDQIRKIFDTGTGRFLHYEFKKDFRSTPIIVHPDSIMVDVYYNPLTTAEGVSPTRVAQRYIEIDAMLTDTNRAFIKNGGVPLLILELDSKLPDGTPKNIKVMKQELEFNKQAYDEQMKIGGSRFKKPLFTAGMKPHPVSIDVDSAMLDSLYNRCESRCAGAYGIPPHKLQVGLEHGDSRANSETQDKEFAEQIIWTQLERIRVKLERSPCFLDWAVDGEFLMWNLEPCKIFHYQTLEMRDQLNKDFKNGTITAEFYNQKMNYPPPPKEIKDLTYFQLTGLRNPQMVNNNNQPKQLTEGNSNTN